MNQIRLLIILSVALAACRCDTKSDASRREPQLYDTVVFRMGEAEVTAEVVFDDTTRKRGLMYRKQMPESRGMLFIFPDKSRRSFYMKNTLIDLSIAYVSDDGRILQIRNMRAKDESSIRSNHEVRFALEVNKGWFGRNGVQVGDRIENFAEIVRPFPAR